VNSLYFCVLTSPFLDTPQFVSALPSLFSGLLTCSLLSVLPGCELSLVFPFIGLLIFFLGTAVDIQHTGIVLL